MVQWGFFVVVIIRSINRQIIKKIEEYYKNNSKTWCSNESKISREMIIRDVIDYDPITYKINAAVLKYERQLTTANITERVEIAERLNVLLNFIQEFKYEIFNSDYDEYGPYNYEYEKTEKQLTKKLLKFLEPEIKECCAKLKDEEKQRMSRIKEYEREKKAERRVASARRGKIYDQIKKM